MRTETSLRCCESNTNHNAVDVLVQTSVSEIKTGEPKEPALNLIEQHVEEARNPGNGQLLDAAMPPQQCGRMTHYVPVDQPMKAAK